MQLWHPVHPDGQDNWTPSIEARVDLPFDSLPAGIQAFQVQYPPILPDNVAPSTTSNDPDIQMDSATQSADQVPATSTSTAHVEGELEGTTNVPSTTTTSNMEVDVPVSIEGLSSMRDNQSGEPSALSAALPFAEDTTLGGTIPESGD